jgi:tetratricopeptide (TPR) repeat protein
VFKIKVGETIAGASAIITLAALFMGIVGDKKYPEKEVKTEIHEDGNVIGNGNIVGDNSNNNVVGNNITVTYNTYDIDKLIKIITAPYISRIKELEETLSRADKSDLEKQELIRHINDLKKELKDKDATIRDMEEARQKNPNPSELYDRAYQLLQKGDMDGALQVLDKEKRDSHKVGEVFYWKREIDMQVFDKEKMDSHSKQTADEFILKAQLLTLKDRYQEAETCYVRAAEIYPSFDTFLAVGNYYYQQNNYNEAEKYYEDCLAMSQDEDEKAIALNNLALLHYATNKHEEAAEEYAEALKIYRRLAQQIPWAYEPDVADTLNNIALLHRDTNKHEEAATEFAESLTIYRQLAQQNPEAYEWEVAEEYAEALNIYRRLAQRSPEAYEPYVANTLYNLALLHDDMNKHEEAIKEATEALTIYEKFAKISPARYQPDVDRCRLLLQKLKE